MHLIVLIMLASWATEPVVEMPSGEVRQRLLAGEVIVETLREYSRGGAARVQAWFAGDVESAWRILQDCEANLSFVPGLEECEVLASTPGSAQSRHVLKRAWYMPRRTYEFETARVAPEWLRIRLTGGDLDALEGFWRFDPLAGGGFVVTHEIHVQPGLPMPRWWVRRVLERDLPDMVACLRAQSGSSPVDVKAEDEARCPT